MVAHARELDKLVEHAIVGEEGAWHVLADWLLERDAARPGLTRLADALGDGGEALRSALGDERLTPLGIACGPLTTAVFRFEPFATLLDTSDARGDHHEVQFALVPPLAGIAPTQPGPIWMPVEAPGGALVARCCVTQRLRRAAGGRVMRWLLRALGDDPRPVRGWSDDQAAAFLRGFELELPRLTDWSWTTEPPFSRDALELVRAPSLGLDGVATLLGRDGGLVMATSYASNAEACLRPSIRLLDAEQPDGELREALGEQGRASARVRAVVRALRKTYRTYHEAIELDTPLRALGSSWDAFSDFNVGYHLERELGVRVPDAVLRSLVDETVAELVGWVELLEEWSA